MKTQDNISLEQGRNILFIFSLFHFSLVAFFFFKLCNAELYPVYGRLIVPLSFLALMLTYLAKWTVCVFIGWVVNHPNELTFIAKGLRDFVILTALLTFPFPLFCLFSWSSAISTLTIWCASVGILCYLLFLFRTLRHFIYARFSVFFWILYLCSLEIAPLALLYSVLLTF